MQNIRKTLKSIDMKKIKKYVVFKYEDEFGFHYMVMDKLPGETLSSEKAKELKRKGEDLKLEKAIEPIQEAYSRLSPSGRSTFVAQMVYLITKQTIPTKKLEKNFLCEKDWLHL